MASSSVLGRPSPCDVPPTVTELSLAARGGRVEKEYASVAGLPAALLEDHFEHPLFEIRQGTEPR